MSYASHVDTFARDNLPPRELWPELVFELQLALEDSSHGQNRPL